MIGKYFFMLVLFLGFLPVRSNAQIDLVGDIIKQALEALDLGVQKVQNQTIGLQEAQKELENVMAQAHLDAIINWTQQQKDLFSQYYQELWEVKSVISSWQKVRDLVNKQVQLVGDYKRASAQARADPHFSAAEVQHICQVLDGIFEQSVKNVDQLYLVVKGLMTQMDDAQRMKMIGEVNRRIDDNYTDLKRYTQENTLLSLQRAKSQSELDGVKVLYGLP
jgi:hypothetical protein